MTEMVLATFETPKDFAAACAEAVRAGWRIAGAWAPFAIEQPPGEGRLLAAIVAGGLCGTAALFALAAWSSAIAYPLNSGGRPLVSWQAFIPFVVEFGALCAAICGVVALFLRARLTRLHAPAFDLAEVSRASDDAFVLALAVDGGEDANCAIALLAAAGATHSRIVVP